MTDTITTIKKAEHERIWLEPAGAPDRCWCQDNQWGDDGVEYVRVSTLKSLQREKDARRVALEEAAKVVDVAAEKTPWEQRRNSLKRAAKAIRKLQSEERGC
jgi:phage gp46-like protein